MSLAPESAVRGEPALEPTLLETLAQAIHLSYRRAQAGSLPEGDISLRPWEALPETLKRSNRDQAAHIVEKMRRIGCSVHPGQENGGRRFRFRRQEIEMLAEVEHERWMAQRLADGWQPGAERNVRDKTSPYFVPYSDLPEVEKEKDRQAVRNIPHLLALAGLYISRT